MSLDRCALSFFHQYQFEKKIFYCTRIYWLDGILKLDQKLVKYKQLCLIFFLNALSKNINIWRYMQYLYWHLGGKGQIWTYVYTTLTKLLQNGFVWWSFMLSFYAQCRIPRWHQETLVSRNILRKHVIWDIHFQ